VHEQPRACSEDDGLDAHHELASPQRRRELGRNIDRMRSTRGEKKEVA
jgi:hypothetical protein